MSINADFLKIDCSKVLDGSAWMADIISNVVSHEHPALV
jgi:hypothetical protein